MRFRLAYFFKNFLVAAPPSFWRAVALRRACIAALSVSLHHCSPVASFLSGCCNFTSPPAFFNMQLDFEHSRNDWATQTKQLHSMIVKLTEERNQLQYRLHHQLELAERLQKVVNMEQSVH